MNKKYKITLIIQPVAEKSGMRQVCPLKIGSCKTKEK